MKFKSSRARLFISLLLVAVILATTVQTPQVQAKNGGEDSQGNGISKKKLEETYVDEGYKVDFEITSQWNSAWMGLITIENPTDKPIQNWYLKFETNNEISDIWNAEIVNHSEDTYVIRNSLWNHDIKSGKSRNWLYS